MLSWEPNRPSILVVACSDGRLQEAIDIFLHDELRVTSYDRFYVPGGPGALGPSGFEYMRSGNLQKECQYLIQLHGVKLVIGIFHGPAEDGPPEAICADYLRKFSASSIADIRARQEEDARRLLADRWQWANNAEVKLFRCEIGPQSEIRFVSLEA